MKWNNYALKFGAIALSTLAFSLTSCKKEGCIDENALNYDLEAQKDDGSCQYQQYGDVTLVFNHVWGMTLEDFYLNQNYMHPKTNDTLNFTLVKYYVSNIKLQAEDGTWWEENESYHLVCAECDLGNTITLDSVPEGNYTHISYTLGVDSKRNMSGAQSGALSVSNEMFWSWNSGYIMLKAEGNSVQAADGFFRFHLGGFTGDLNVVTERTTDFGGQTMTLGAEDSKKLSFNSNVAHLWHNAIDLDSVSVVHMPGEMAVKMAQPFFEGITFTAIGE